MDKEKLQKAIMYASKNPQSDFAVELKQRIKRGEFNDILKESGVDTTRYEPPKKESFIKRASKAIFKSEAEFGKSIAGAIDVGASKFGIGATAGFEKAQSQKIETMNQITQAIKAKRERGEDTTKLKKMLVDMSSSSIKNELLERQAGLSTRQVLGQGLGVATDIIGAGTIGTKGAGLVTQPTSFLKGALKGAGTGAATGGGFGATQGLARGMQEDRKGADLASEVISGGLVGGLAGGVLGGLTGGISGRLRGKALRKQQLKEELVSNPELVAKYNLSDVGKIKKDKIASEVIRQGVDEKYVAVIKNSNPTDKIKFKKMLKLAERASKDARAIERPSDEVGRTIIDRTSHLLKKVRAFGKAVDDTAETLKGKSISAKPAIDNFYDDLSDMGIKIKNGKPIFDGSDIEGIAPAENLINKVVHKLNGLSDDAYKLHRVKRFIDEQVTFGKVGEGLSGETERLVKGLRRNIDGLLDVKFSNYNKANTSFAEAIGLLDETKSVLGRNFNPTTGNVRAGAVARRILGNSANRGDILEYLSNLEVLYKKTGGTSADDIISQTVFADVLEDIFGTQATTGLQGQVQRGVEQAGGVVQDIAQGQPLAALTRGAVRVYQGTRGVDHEAKVRALRALLGL